MFHHFYRATQLCQRGLGSRNSVCLSVRLSVCLSVTRVLCDTTKQRTADILIVHEREVTLVFRHQQWLVDDAPPSEICAQSDPPLRNTPTWTDFRLSRLNRKR